MAQDKKTKIDDAGLRYKSKQPGSPFPPATSGNYSSMSCFFCGTHRSPAQRKMQSVLGRSQPVCEPVCSKNPKAKKLASTQG
jgi:hypothetical protein